MVSGSLEGKIAFITGGSRGIGAATAENLARHGAAVILSGVSDLDSIQAKAESIRKTYGVLADAFLCDVSDASAVKKSYEFIFGKYKRLDILVNNAGIVSNGLLGMIPEDQVDAVLGINVRGVIYNLQYASRLMARQKSGSIVNIASIVGRVGNAGQVLYAGSKSAVIGMTLSAAKELAPSGIRVNAVAPGLIDTDMIRSLPPDIRVSIERGIRMGRVGRPEEVADAVYFLASDLSGYITGQVLGVDGGLVI